MSFNSWVSVRTTLLKDIYKIWKAMDAERKESAGSYGSSSSSSSVSISTIMDEYDAAVRREGGNMSIAKAQTLWR